MANFMIPASGGRKELDINEFNVPVDTVPIALEQWGGDSAGNQLQLDFWPPSAIELEIVKKMPGASTLFTVVGRVPGLKVTLGASVKGTNQKYSENLILHVKNTPANQPGYTVDMLADLALSGSAQKVHIYNLIMTNPAPLLKQNTEAGHYNCGDVSGAYGKKLFDKPTSVSNYAYYLTPTSDVMADLRFDPGTLKLRIAHIKALINQGISVRVWLVHDDGFSTHIVASDPTHYVTIVGYSESKFLILDPWPGGSAFKYSGGMYPSRDIGYIGQLEFDPHRLELGIRNSPESEGSMKYTVVGGPP